VKAELIWPERRKVIALRKASKKSKQGKRRDLSLHFRPRNTWIKYALIEQSKLNSGAQMSLGTILLIILVLLLIGALPSWPYSAQWG
jgi:uncharacterized protein DUF3309